MIRCWLVPIHHHRVVARHPASHRAARHAGGGVFPSRSVRRPHPLFAIACVGAAIGIGSAIPPVAESARVAWMHAPPLHELPQGGDLLSGLPPGPFLTSPETRSLADLPEPSSVAVFAGGFLATLFVRRRR